MMKLLTVGFEFRDVFYYALIRVKEQDHFTEYKITVMNGNLEKLLYGSHVLRASGGFLHLEMLDESEQQLLKLSIAQALSNFLHMPLKTGFLADKVY